MNSAFHVPHSGRRKRPLANLLLYVRLRILALPAVDSWKMTVPKVRQRHVMNRVVSAKRHRLVRIIRCQDERDTAKCEPLVSRGVLPYLSYGNHINGDLGSIPLIFYNIKDQNTNS